MLYINSKTGVTADLATRPGRGWEPIKAPTPTEGAEKAVKKPATRKKPVKGALS